MILIPIDRDSIRRNKNAGSTESCYPGLPFEVFDDQGKVIGMEREVHRVYHQPIPEFSYDHQNIELTCPACGEKVMSEDLEEYVVDPGLEWNTNNCCPYCEGQIPIQREKMSRDELSAFMKEQE